MKKKSIFCTMLLLCAALFFVNCGGDSDDDPENKDQEPVTASKEFALSNLFVKFFDVDLNIQTTPFSSLRSKMAKFYTLSEETDHSYYIERSKNKSLANYTYLGKPFYRHFVGEYDLFRSIMYEFEIEYSEDPYPYMDKLIQDLSRMGVNITYEKSNNEYVKAEGEAKVGNKEYEIMLWNTNQSWLINISVRIYP